MNDIQQNDGCVDDVQDWAIGRDGISERKKALK